MTEQHPAGFEPGIYVKGDRTRRAESRADAVALVWDGFVRQAEDKDASNQSGGSWGPSTHFEVDSNGVATSVPSGAEPPVEFTDTPTV